MTTCERSNSIRTGPATTDVVLDTEHSCGWRKWSRYRADVDHLERPKSRVPYSRARGAARARPIAGSASSPVRVRERAVYAPLVAGRMARVPSER